MNNMSKWVRPEIKRTTLNFFKCTNVCKKYFVVCINFFIKKKEITTQKIYKIYHV